MLLNIYHKSKSLFVTDTNTSSSNMISHDDKILIREIRKSKGWGAKKLLSEFPEKGWKLPTINKLLKKIDSTGDVKRRVGSGRPRKTRTPANIRKVQELILSQEEDDSHANPGEIERSTGIPRTTVRRIVKDDFHLKVFKKKSPTPDFDTEKS